MEIGIAKLKNQSGFTILEVMIAATVFMIGFAVMISLLDTTISRASTKELFISSSVADELMIESILVKDTTSFDSVITQGNISYDVKKISRIQDKLVEINITVTRRNTGKKLIELHNEFIISEK